jgi:hypothetical protein
MKPHHDRKPRELLAPLKKGFSPRVFFFFPSSSNRDSEEGEIREETGSRPKTRFSEPKERIMKEAKPENK